VALLLLTVLVPVWDVLQQLLLHAMFVTSGASVELMGCMLLVLLRPFMLRAV
jgi:hypothetical protein